MINRTEKWATTAYATLRSDPEWIFAYPVVVAWQASDLGVISPQKVQANPPAQGLDSSSTNSSLSLAAKIGLGIGVPVVVAILIAILWVVLWRRHKRRLAIGDISEYDAGQEKAELPGVGKPRWDPQATELDMENAVHECDGGQKGPVEADFHHALAELDSGWRGWEVPEDRK